MNLFQLRIFASSAALILAFLLVQHGCRGIEVLAKPNQAVKLTTTPNAKRALVIENVSMVTYNMLGGTMSSESKWTSNVTRLVQQYDVVALQEAGTAPPSSSTQVSRHNTSNGLLTIHNWNAGTGSEPVNLTIYFLQTDPNGNRVNLALVVKGDADEWKTIPPGITGRSRPGLGIRKGAVWFYTLHGLSGNGNDGANLLRNIEAASNPFVWVSLGDYNRDPSDLQVPSGAKVYSTGLATHISGREHDYFISNDIVDCDHGDKTKQLKAIRLNGMSADHWPVASSVLPCVKKKNKRIRVMALGASFTIGQGSSDGAGYRKRLKSRLEDDVTSASVDMVGRNHNGTIDDNAHEGYSGFMIDQIDAKAECALPAFQPSLVTIIAGTNDMVRDYEVATAGDRLGALIDEVLKDSPRATVLVQTLPPNTDPANPFINDHTMEYNRTLVGVIEARARADKHVLLLNAALTAADITSDHIHPNGGGYVKIADKFIEGAETAAARERLEDPEPVSDGVDSALLTCHDELKPRDMDLFWDDKGVIIAQQFPSSSRFRFGDVNRDGRTEYFVIDSEQGFKFWWNSGPSATGWTPWGLGITRSPMKPGLVGNQMWLAQLDDDRRIDLAIVDLEGNLTPYIWNDLSPVGQQLGGSNVGGGVTLDAPPFPSTTQIVFADLNGDGRDDYLLVKPHGRTRIWVNDGLSPRGYLLAFSGSYLLAEPGELEREYRYADLNGDKRADRILITANGGARAWLNTGITGLPSASNKYVTWRDIGQIAPDQYVPPKDVQFVDLDGDGRADFLRVSWTGWCTPGSTSCLLHTSTPTIRRGIATYQAPLGPKHGVVLPNRTAQAALRKLFHLDGSTHQMHWLPTNSVEKVGLTK